MSFFVYCFFLYMFFVFVFFFVCFRLHFSFDFGDFFLTKFIFFSCLIFTVFSLYFSLFFPLLLFFAFQFLSLVLIIVKSTNKSALFLSHKQCLRKRQTNQNNLWQSPLFTFTLSLHLSIDKSIYRHNLFLYLNLSCPILRNRLYVVSLQNLYVSLNPV